MNFLFPAMFAGALGLGVPVVIHLIARHRFPVQGFPTIRLLRYERRANVFAWTLVDVKQLLLRLLVLALLVLAMARLFAPWASSEPAPHNLVIVLDASASMRATTTDPATEETAVLFDMARTRARTLLESIRPPSHCAVVVAGGRTTLAAPLAITPDAALAAVDAAACSDGSGPGLVAAVAESCRLLAGRREVQSKVVVLTDLRTSAFAQRNQKDLAVIREVRDRLGDRLEIVAVDLAGGRAGNLYLSDAYVRGDEVRMGDDLHVMARVVNDAPEDATARLRLSVGGRKEPYVREIPLAPGGEAVVDMTSRVSRAVRTFAEVELKGDDVLPRDDRFESPVVVSEPRRVLIVRPAPEETAESATRMAGLGGETQAADTADAGAGGVAIDGATILRFVLNPARELGAGAGTGILTTLVTEEALARQPLSKYDLVILYDVSGLPEGSLEDLAVFVRQGKALLFFCGPALNPGRFNRSLAAGGADRPPLAPVAAGNEEERAPAVGLDLRALIHPLLAPFRDRVRGDLSVVRFARIRTLRDLPADVDVLMTAEDGTPLLVERRVGAGRTALAAFGVELDRGSLARSRVFPVLMWRLVDHLSGRLDRRPPDQLAADRPAVLDVSENAFAFEDTLTLSPLARAPEAAPDAVAPDPMQPAIEPRETPIRPGRTVLLEGLPAGRYQLHKASKGTGNGERVLGYARNISVNPDSRESRMDRLAPTALPDTLGVPAAVVDAAGVQALVPRGAELWTWVVALLAAAYLIEALAGYRASVRREEERAAEFGDAA